MTEDGQTLAEVITDPAVEAPRCCPRCGKAATRVKEHPRTAPRDMYLGDRQVLLAWRKTRWHCDTPGCGQGTFTERLPAVKARARLTSRLRTRLGQAVGDDLMPAAAAAPLPRRTHAARAFTAYADERLADLDSERTRSRRPGSMSSAAAPLLDGAGPETGEVTRTRSEWLTHLVDLDGGGALGLAEGRTAAAEEGLLTGHAARLRYLAMDLSAAYRSGAPAGVDPDRGRLSPGGTRQQEDRRGVPAAVLPHRARARGTRPAPPAALHAPVQRREPGPRSPGRHHRRAATPTPTASRSPRSGSPRSTCATCWPCAPPAPASPPPPARSATSSPASTSGAPITTASPR